MNSETAHFVHYSFQSYHYLKNVITITGQLAHRLLRQIDV